MPNTDAATQRAKSTLFLTGYRNCRTLRDIFGYLNREKTQLVWHPHMQVSRDLIAAIKLSEFSEEVIRWRDVNAEPWQHLVDKGLVIVAVEEQHRRPIEQLTQTCLATDTIIRALEHRLFKVLLDYRFADHT
jgi:hypothetical protein